MSGSPGRQDANSPSGQPSPPGTRTTTTTTYPSTTTTTTTTIHPTAPAITSTSTITTPPRRDRPGLFPRDSGGEPWRNESSIRIRRQPSSQAMVQDALPGQRGFGSQASQQAQAQAQAQAQRLRESASAEYLERNRAGSVGGSRLRQEVSQDDDTEFQGNRRRSSSDPNRSFAHDRMNTGRPVLGLVQEGVPLEPSATAQNLTVPEAAPGRVPGRRFSAASLMRFPSFRPSTSGSGATKEKPTEADVNQAEYDQQLLDVLDTLDPEVSTLNTLNNVQNSLFVPNLGKYLNRRPTYTLTKYPTRPITGTVPAIPTPIPEPGLEGPDGFFEPQRSNTITSITSNLDEDHFAVLPHGERLHGWSKEEIDELNDHVRHLLHSRKEKFKRSMKGFGQYVKKPLGFLVTLYATLITLFGLAWVLFLIGWINVGGKRDYIVNIIDNILVALFAIMGDGLAPFRAVDTYHMCFIAHYHHLTWKLRKQRALPKLENKNDLPALTVNDSSHTNTTSNDMPDLEAEEKLGEMSVLNPTQQKRLVHHQKKFSRSHTFYKPHETETHFAFPLRILVAVVCLLDCHSLFQIALGTCTWSIPYQTRPFALTTVILCCSITCNITAGVFITIGDHKSRKKDVLERMFRQELTAQAIHKLEKRRERERNQQLEMEQIQESSDEGPPVVREVGPSMPLGSGALLEENERESKLGAEAVAGVV